MNAATSDDEADWTQLFLLELALLQPDIDQPRVSRLAPIIWGMKGRNGAMSPAEATRGFVNGDFGLLGP